MQLAVGMRSTPKRDWQLKRESASCMRCEKERVGVLEEEGARAQEAASVTESCLLMLRRDRGERRQHGGSWLGGYRGSWEGEPKPDLIGKRNRSYTKRIETGSSNWHPIPQTTVDTQEV